MKSEAWLGSLFPCCAYSSFCLSHYLHLSFSSPLRTLIWKEGAPLPTQYVLCLFWLIFPAKLHRLKISLLAKTLGSYISFYSLCLFFFSSRPRRRNILNRLGGGKERPTPIQRVVKVRLTLWKHHHDIDIRALVLSYIKAVFPFFICREDIHTWAQD